ncbi:PilZ domain-containing protein [Novosphingobium sp. Gsoil 351]|uniref:PilZ domain-containing protein n=1 Tax=Novosphingobium sp. Gsoil 351 TaxID=2675225 RepID=UPI001E54C776|nr:PilZ domain-containing protein [Novosphingobium sp. Gsoil 351]
MVEDENRRAPRDSVFLFATLRLAGEDAEYRVKVRNLSETGLLAEGDVPVRPGSSVGFDLRNIGWVEGTVAWVLGDRFGVQLGETIDPTKARS